ncbi:hypothetical protein CN326_13865 [Bacillus sp. AFS018417]|uniref:beta family protein n=1 Tax=Bacillus sp. AFS018417 TaxID=2033491 RepID=UPI000BF30DA9|nr:hypothetical protein [Bacillus sp. AFS018417]PEZ05546.1 hypothetical protein CN326_13865 [Bacillus sp. AFS018417]
MSTYFPILKNSTAEMNALQQLKSVTKESIVPIIESKVIKPANQAEWWQTFGTLGSYLSRKVNGIKFIYDFMPAFNEIGEASESMVCPNTKNLITYCIDKMEESTLNYIPCVHFDSPDWIINSVIQNTNSNEIAIRIRCHDFNSPMEDFIIERVNEKIIGAAPSKDFYIILDFSNVAINQSRISNSITNFSRLQHSHIILALTNCPGDAAKISPSTFDIADARIDFQTYMHLKETFPTLHFGDYTVRIKGEPDQNANIDYYNTYLKIFYTTEDNYMIGKSALLKNDGIETFISICQEIVDSDVYKSQEFSNGDHAIKQCADEVLKITNHQKPIEFGINHHIELVADQLQQQVAVSTQSRQF